MDEIKTLLAKEAIRGIRSTFTAARLTVLTMNWGILCSQRTAR